MCVHGAQQWTGILSRVYCCLLPSFFLIGSWAFMILTRISGYWKWVIKCKLSNYCWNSLIMNMVNTTHKISFISLFIGFNEKLLLLLIIDVLPLPQVWLWSLAIYFEVGRLPHSGKGRLWAHSLSWANHHTQEVPQPGLGVWHCLGETEGHRWELCIFQPTH